MSGGFSVYLNLVRFGAALVVLASHFAFARFSDGRYQWLRDLNLGSDAVVVFFVLSGLVIAMAAAEKDRTFGRFLFSRATRVYSVAIPVLIVGFVLDRAGAALSPGVYAGWGYAPVALHEMLLRGLSFSNEWAGKPLWLGSNVPYWSLSYEVAYYLLFGVVFFMTGIRRAALLGLGLAVFGLNIILLAPAWVLGVVLYRRLLRADMPTAGAALVMALGPVGLYALCLWARVPEVLAYLTQAVSGARAMDALRFSDEFVWNALLGCLVMVHLYGAAALARGGWLGQGHRLGAVAAWLAGGSFSLYLVHYPLLQFLRAALPGTGMARADDALLFALTLAGCFVFAAIFERPLKTWRRALLALAGRQPEPRPA